MRKKSALVRRVLLVVVASFSPFFLTLVGNSIVQVHTRDGKAAMYAIRHSQEMTDEQLTRAIGDDPVAVVRRAGLMARSIAPMTVLISGILVALFERRIPGKITAIVLVPYFLWDFSMSTFSAARVLTTDIVYMVLSVLTAVVVARLLSHGRLSKLSANPV